MRTLERPPAVIAHRGASAYAPENTVAAFDLAVAMGADSLELDVRATRDGVLVLLHDRTLERTTGDRRAIADVTAAELRELEPALRPPTLAEVLDRYGRRTRYLVELKDPDHRHDRLVVGALADRGLQRRAVVQSFDHLALSRIARRDGSLRLAALLAEGADALAGLDALAPCVSAVGVCHRSVDRTVVLAARMRGLAVRAWTVNDGDEIERMLELGVDGVITDVPDRARSLIVRRPRTGTRAA